MNSENFPTTNKNQPKEANNTSTQKKGADGRKNGNKVTNTDILGDIMSAMDHGENGCNSIRSKKRPDAPKPVVQCDPEYFVALTMFVTNWLPSLPIGMKSIDLKEELIFKYWNMFQANFAQRRPLCPELENAQFRSENRKYDLHMMHRPHPPVLPPQPQIAIKPTTILRPLLLSMEIPPPPPRLQPVGDSEKNTEAESDNMIDENNPSTGEVKESEGHKLTEKKSNTPMMTTNTSITADSKSGTVRRKRDCSRENEPPAKRNRESSPDHRKEAQPKTPSRTEHDQRRAIQNHSERRFVAHRPRYNDGSREAGNRRPFERSNWNGSDYRHSVSRHRNVSYGSRRYPISPLRTPRTPR